ncbi:predicted protein [Bathycoccus prasinos]|uniref:Uncharacterized protein n=1 Tax=Bathycoccus prasinos TaxID=41875 RepID=K8FAD2_9CHLO|nr:predicted protein [Bathycoccus prasinos]CCO18573.1 predicted protein [Bathycoccus prasinos]|eukprot:XP_007510228.1 predicted protein [Bathycoccus prasinos]
MNAEVRNQLAREVLRATLSSSSLGEKASESSIKGGGDDVFAASAMIVASIKSGEYSRALKSVLCFAFQPLSLNNNNRGEEVLEEKEFALFLAGVCGLCLHQRANACGPPLHLEEEEEEEEEEEGFANAILQAFRDGTFRDGGNGGFALNDAQNADGLLHGDVDGVFGSSRASIGEMDEEEKDRRRAKRRKRRAFEKVLSRDGEDASGRIEHPECLALAVECLVNSKQMMKRLEFVERDETLDVSARPSPMGRCRRAAAEALDGEETTNSNEEFHVVRDWFAARCALAHQRVLFGRTVTLRKQCLGFFARALEGLSRASSLVGDNEKKKIEDAHYLYGTCLIEASLMEHEFGVDDSARYLLKRAKDALGVTIEKSGALGYRTIHQQDAKAQLVLRVTCKERASAESDDEDENDDDTDEDESIAAGSGGGNESDDTEVADGAKASNSSSSSSAMSRLRVELEGLSADGSQILPKPKLQNASDADDPSLNAPLSTIAQVVLLAECVAVRKKQADDGLRNWEMTPYLERVLTQAKSRPIVRASATVLMTRHEKTRARTRERALLSLEDVTRSVSEVPANAIKKMRQSKKVKRDLTTSLSKIGKERLRFAFSVWFPPIHALKKELGEALISIGMVGAALKLFEEIEHWDAYISCLELLGKKQQAADVVKTRLNEEPGNAKLWCALGDATGDETCYHKAWEVSEERDARSQRTLARLCAQRNDFAQAVVHWTRALTLNPLFPGAWFNCGYCRMKCEGREDDALAAFVRCAQIDPENGQAWNNVAALSMHKQKFQAARAALQEAVKHYRTSWHTWENLAIASAKTGRFVASARALMKVIELTDGARVHIPTISTLLDMCEEGRKLGPEKCEWMRDAEKWEREANKKKDATLLSLNASDDEGEASDDDEEEDWNDAACSKAAADIASFFSDFSVNDTEANTTTATATGTKFNVRDEEIDEKTGAPRIVVKIEELLEQILAKAASGNTNSGGGNNASGAPPRAMHDTAAIWHLVSRHAENCGDFASSVEAKLKVVRALDASGWRKDGNAFDAYVSAAMNWANALKKESSACTKKSVASARMLLKSAVKIAQNEGFDERATYAPLTKTFESVEEIEKSFD